MPSYLCKCGTRIDYTDIPAAASYKVIGDADVDVDDELDMSFRSDRSKEALLCANCGRFWIFWNGFHNPPTEYMDCGVDSRDP